MRLTVAALLLTTTLVSAGSGRYSRYGSSEEYGRGGKKNDYGKDYKKGYDDKKNCLLKFSTVQHV